LTFQGQLSAVSKDLEHAVALETLRNEIPVEALELPVVGNALTAAKPSVERLRQQGIGIDILEYLVDCS
jgi:hypothetical protein